MKELIVRGVSGLFYISIIIFSMFVSYDLFLGLFLLLATLTLFEFLKLIKLKNYIPYVILFAAIYFLSYKVFNQYALNVYLILSLIINSLLLINLFSSNSNSSIQKRKFILSVFYIISGFVFLTLLATRNSEFTPELIGGIFVLVWANDSFAYLVGKNFGKRKLLEIISPKKTIEGFVGGLLGALILSYFVATYTGTYSIIVWIIISLFISGFGTLGDLIQSKFKRQAGVKDSGAIMPGHGGIYDRLDSIIYCSPFIFAFLELIDYVS